MSYLEFQEIEDSNELEFRNMLYDDEIYGLYLTENCHDGLSEHKCWYENEHRLRYHIKILIKNLASCLTEFQVIFNGLHIGQFSRNLVAALIYSNFYL